MPRIPGSEFANGVSSNLTIYLPEGGTLRVDWSCTRTYSLLGDPNAPVTGEEKVAYGFLDDTGTGYRVSISGLRSSVSSYTVSLIASANSEQSFADAQVVRGSVTNFLKYGHPRKRRYELQASFTSRTAEVPLSVSNTDRLNGVTVSVLPAKCFPECSRDRTQTSYLHELTRSQTDLPQRGKRK